MPCTAESRLAYADWLRAAAVFAVVVVHISASSLSQTAAGSPDWIVMCAYDTLVRWCVPVFVMLSGAFLLDPKKQVAFGDIFRKYILRVLIALLVWGSFYALLDYGHVNWHFTWESVKNALLDYVLRAQTHYHLWFLYMIIGLYLITPILRAFVRGASRRDFHWFFAVVFLFYSLLPTLRALFPNRMALPVAWANALDIHLVLGFVGYYVAGYYLKHYTLNRSAKLTLYSLGILGAVAAMWGTAVLSIRNGIYRDTLFAWHTPTVVFISVAVFVLFRYELEGCAHHRLLGGISRISFGIFLVHDFFVCSCGILASAPCPLVPSSPFRFSAAWSSCAPALCLGSFQKSPCWAGI